MTPTLSRIVRYPIKGLPGELLDNAILTPGHGIAHDRRFAIENGSQAALQSRSWAACKHFVRLTVDRTLVRYGVRYKHRQRRLAITTPTGETLSVYLDSLDDRRGFDALLSRQFVSGSHCAVKLTEHSGASAYWDFADAPISIINLKTIEAISNHAQESFAADRFRANLELDGIDPWAELGWIGRTVDIGGVLFYITAAIERCAATSVNPLTGELGTSVPQVLRVGFGHLYCGVYARVVSGGQIKVGATVRPPSMALPLTIRSVRAEGHDTVSLTIGSHDGAVLPPFVPGQYLTVHMARPGGTSLARHYTVSNEPKVPQTSYRISVKKKGAVSTWLGSLAPGVGIDVSAPKGNFLLRHGPRIPVLVGGGIGITPFLPMLQQMAQEDPERKIWLLYGARDWASLPFKDELLIIAQRVKNLRIHLFFSRGMPAEKSAPFHYHTGRISIDKLRTVLPFDAYEFYLCGPTAMLRNVSEGLMRLGVPNQHIHVERFGLSDDLSTPHAFPQQARIQFVKSQREGFWQERAHTLLDFAEILGITAPYDCRAGTCGACRCPVRGQVHYAMQPVFALKPNEALLCCARPLENLEIDL